MSVINVEEIKQYNKNLKEFKDKASKLDAEIEFNQAELDRLCVELSAECGETVTPENLESIRNARLERINNTLNTGREILDRIRNDENVAINGYVAEQAPVQQVFAQQAPVQQPVYQAQAYPQAPAQQVFAPQQQVFNQQAAQAPLTGAGVFSGLGGQTILDPVSAIPTNNNTGAIVI